MHHPDLFDQPQRYPLAPGHRDTDTSRAAADSMRSEAGGLRALCLAALDGADLTADEVAERVGKSILAIRPRLTEMHRLGLATDTGTRRVNASGRKAIVWRLV